MKKVMIVDDEKLVRQGIITTFPWEKHGFRVACEAGSGEKALELLEREEVDLLVTDLAMNGMSGLELIKRARDVRSDLPVVILTCHDNFKYIQEAIRLGVLDYIVKTEIEDEAVDETLKRIAAKMNGEPRASRTERSAEEPAQDGLLFCGPTRSSAAAALFSQEDREGWIGRLAEVDTATWFLRVAATEADRLKAALTPALEAGNWTCVRISGIDDDDDRKVSERLRRYRRRALFYRPANADLEWEWNRPFDERPADEKVVADIRNGWSEPDWIYSGERFEALLRMTADAGLEPGELKNLFYPAALEWERLLKTGALQSFLDQADEWLYWKDWAAWLREFRQTIRRTVERNASRHNVDAVFRAIELIRSRLDSDVSEADIAFAVNMSRGHFSKSFKKVTGKSYGEYVRSLKMENAKEMILRTDEPITRVAEKCGFQDYRYFSRVFREYTGKLPTEFRKTGGV